MGGIFIQMPESPGSVLRLVIHQLEQVFGYMHQSPPNARALGNVRDKDGAGDDIYIAGGSVGIFSGRILDGLGPCPPIVLRCLWNHIGQ